MADKEYGRLNLTEVMSFCKIRTGRRFELQELCTLFVGKPAGIVCTVFVIVYVCNWTNIAISATAIATNVPVSDHGTFLGRCTDEDFHFRLHPVGTCWNTYLLSVLLVGVIGLAISLTKLAEMSILQTAIAIVRFATFGAMIIYSVVTAIEGKDEKDDGKVPWFQFSFHGLVAAIPTMVYAHTSVVALPSITNPVDNKNGLTKMWMGIFVTASSFCGILGLTVAIRFKCHVNEIASLNWVSCDIPFVY